MEQRAWKLNRNEYDPKHTCSLIILLSMHISGTFESVMVVSLYYLHQNNPLKEQIAVLCRRIFR